MTLLGELLREPPPRANTEKAKPAVRFGPAACSSPLRRPSIREEQIHSLVEQLFFRHESGPVRRVGITAVGASTSIASLCLEVSKALVHEGRYEVGLIDASTGEHELTGVAHIPVHAGMPGPWAIAPRLWLVPRESWCSEAGAYSATNHNLELLRERIAEFDFSVVHCPPEPCLAARIGRCCDGLVLVLSANRTRRLVAAQIKDYLHKIRIPVLGTILMDRRFPVPEGLYRSL